MNKKELLLVESCIPAYEPPPCKCCEETATDNRVIYECNCDCGSLGDHEDAAAWCARMEIADKWDRDVYTGIISYTPTSESTVK